MTQVIPDGAAAVIHSLVLSGDPEPFAITYGVGHTCATAADVADLAADLHAAYDDNINPNNPSSLTLIETVVRAKVVGIAGLTLGVDLTPQAGAGGSLNLVPQNTALLVHKRGPVAGNGGRGRMYFPALNEANVDSVGQISGAWLSTMNTALSAWLSDIISATFSVGMVILHNDPGAHSADAPALITSLAADPIAASQRRRLRH
jgi:hypothetical protein